MVARKLGGRKMKTKQALAFAAIVLILVSTIPVLITQRARAASDTQIVKSIDLGNAQTVNGTVTQVPSPPPTSLPSGFQPINGSDPSYDEQIGLFFVQNFTSITYNILAAAPMDNDYLGPAYLVNGLTNAGYWYQAGLAYSWSGNRLFEFCYEVWEPGTPKPISIFPIGGGCGLSLFSGTVNVGDLVTVSLSFASGNVTMQASDSTTGANASTTYSAENASYFEGGYNGVGEFSGLMTEWYHYQAYTDNETQATYFDEGSSLQYGMYFAGEIGLTNYTYVTPPFSYTPAQWPYLAWCFDWGPTPAGLHVSEYSNASELITGTQALCALKTMTTGYFYVPNATCLSSQLSSQLGYNVTSIPTLRVEMLLTNPNTVGDQFGGGSPYTVIADYPNGVVDMSDIAFVVAHYGTKEGQSNWNYMADITGDNGVPDRVVDISDVSQVAANYGNSGSYSPNVYTNVTIHFNVGGNEGLNSIGFATIPPGATSFNVTQNGTPVGAMITFTSPYPYPSS
jgi:hypothetical protein